MKTCSKCGDTKRTDQFPGGGQCTRGLLCNPCNAVLGLVDDSTSVLLKAVSYLEDK